MVGIEPARPRERESDAVDEHEVGEWVPVSLDDEGARRANVCDQVGVDVTEGPDDGVRVGERDRAVPVLERGIRLGRNEGRLAQLQRRLVRESDRPPAAEEDEGVRRLAARGKAVGEGELGLCGG
jgi:hypothetical protein